MLIGYARISTDDQNMTLQIDALKKAGCRKIFDDTISGAKAERPGLDNLLASLREGDTLVIWRLDRLGRTMKDLLYLSERLKKIRVQLVSLHESIDTTTATGKLIFHTFAALAEFERNLIRERTHAGLKASRARGKIGGRKPALNKQKRATVVKLYLDQSMSVGDLCEMAKISRPTLYKYVEQEKLFNEELKKVSHDK